MIQRIDGQETPYIPAGIFKIRLPFVHYRLELPEAVQGFFLVAVALGSIGVHQAVLGVPFDWAIAMVALNGVMYLLHPVFGDPVFPGWITPAIPLVMAYAAGFPLEVLGTEVDGNNNIQIVGQVQVVVADRIHAIIALQLLMAVLFTFLGVTGLAGKLVGYVPNSMRAGIILGAGMAAAINVIEVRMVGQVYTILVGTLVCYIIMFSWRFFVAKDKNAFLGILAKFGMLPGFIVAAIVGPILGEISAPKFSGVIFQNFFSNMGNVIANFTIFSPNVGFPPATFFIQALPLMFAAYIIAFGDFVLAEVVVKDADVARPDEVIDFNPNRSNIIAGLRNFVLAFLAPYGPLNGPLWAGGQVAVAERFKMGKKGMYSIFGGLVSYTGAMAIAGFLMVVIDLVRPVLPAGLTLTLIVQAYACYYIAMEMCRTKEERGIAGIMATFLALKGAAWGLATGIILHLIIGVVSDEEKMAYIRAQKATKEA